MAVSNPRYPHWCKIVRKKADSPMEDEDTAHIEYDPMRDEDENMNDDDNQETENSVTEETETEENTDEGSQVTVIYEGECRSYKINTTSDKGDVITSQRGLALPLNQDGWDALGDLPKEGDEIIVLHGTTFQEYGIVIDKNVATASFAGTHLIWRYGRN